MKRNQVQIYMDEMVNYGGYWVPRWRMIVHLQGVAMANHPDEPQKWGRMVNAYLAGHARNEQSALAGQVDQSDWFLQSVQEHP